MPKSLADLRNSPHVGRPEAEQAVCVAGKLNAEFDAIEAELGDLVDALEAEADPDTPSPPKRMGRARNPKVDELNKRREKLRREMAEHMVTLRLRGLEDGAWRAWVSEHQPREDNRTDAMAGYDVDALIDWIRDEPRKMIVSINGEDFSDEDWKFVWSNLAEGDRWKLAGVVRRLHVTAVDVPKSLTPWLETLGHGSFSS